MGLFVDQNDKGHTGLFADQKRKGHAGLFVDQKGERHAGLFVDQKGKRHAGLIVDQDGKRRAGISWIKQVEIARTFGLPHRNRSKGYANDVNYFLKPERAAADH